MLDSVVVCHSIFGLAALDATTLVITMASTKHTPQSTQTPPWRPHFMVRFIPILALGVISVVYLNGRNFNDDAQGRIGMDKLLNEPVLKDEPLLLNNEPVLKGAEQKGQGGEVIEETMHMHDSILLPVDPVATPSTKSAKAKEGDPKSKAAKAKSKSKSAKAEGAKAEKHDGKSKGAKSGKSKKSKAAKAKEGESAKAEKHDGKATKGSAKAAKGKEKSKGGAKSEKKKSAKATAEKLALDFEEEIIEEEVEAEYTVENAE